MVIFMHIFDSSPTTGPKDIGYAVCEVTKAQLFTKVREHVPEYPESNPQRHDLGPPTS